MTPIATTYPELFSTICTTSSCPRLCSRFTPPDGRHVCRIYLARAVRPARLDATLASLLAAGIIRGWETVGDVIHLDADRVALELAVEALEDAE